MQLSCTEIETIVKNTIIECFPKERVICVLRYGPEQSQKGERPTDYDFLILLDTFDAEDYQKIANLNLPIEIFIDYKSHIELRGSNNYKRGCHGTYFIHILATAKLLLGTNYFQTLLKELSPQKERSDLLDRIEEYFYRIQKAILNNSTHTAQVMPKSLARIVTDLLLFNNEITYPQMHQLHYSDILKNTVTSTSLFTEEEKNALTDYFTAQQPSLEKTLPVIQILYRSYTTLLTTHHETNTQDN